MSRPETFRELMLAEDPGFADVMRCVFGIQEHETETYLAVFDSPDSTVAELADELDARTEFVHDRIDDFGGPE